MRDARTDLRDVLLTVLLPPVGLLFVSRGLVVPDRRRATSVTGFSRSLCS